jgi:hypothetical protein
MVESPSTLTTKSSDDPGAEIGAMPQYGVRRQSAASTALWRGMQIAAQHDIWQLR